MGVGHGGPGFTLSPGRVQVGERKTIVAIFTFFVHHVPFTVLLTEDGTRKATVAPLVFRLPFAVRNTVDGMQFNNESMAVSRARPACDRRHAAAHPVHRTK